MRIDPLVAENDALQVRWSKMTKSPKTLTNHEQKNFEMRFSSNFGNDRIDPLTAHRMMPQLTNPFSNL